jgi:hypothetical protein
MDKVAKLILNSLKCPVCGGQIDLLDWTKLEQKPKDQNFSCVYDPEHYGVWLVHWEHPIRLEFERATVYEGHHQYMVSQHHWMEGVPHQRTTVLIRKVDPEHRILDTEKPKLFTYDQKLLFDFTKTNREKLVNRIKTILTFQ